LLAGAKRTVEQLLWTLVAIQGAIEARGSGERPVPATVPPTAVLQSRAGWQAAVAQCRRLRLPLHQLSRVDRDARVLDAGSARYSVVLPWLQLYGLRNLVGINLEFGPEVRRGAVRFRYGDVTATDFPAETLDAVTCLSVIEHGVAVEAFVDEVARILRLGGVLCVSTGYDQRPPDTTGLVGGSGVPVNIFGPDDIRELVSQAGSVGLRLQGELNLDHAERPVHWRRTGLDCHGHVADLRARLRAPFRPARRGLGCGASG
jgi:SAM-dependent methyltransferase